MDSIHVKIFSLVEESFEKKVIRMLRGGFPVLSLLLSLVPFKMVLKKILDKIFCFR
jgi:hypothetical protein